MFIFLKVLFRFTTEKGDYIGNSIVVQISKKHKTLQKE